ncbi:hypothetical protein QE410_002988 [Microbacterium sp. SORGH_AS 1204]|uniref:hypothetical protein n=1 Tax=Microbacterium sp. SORGH_AS_1204 TaxID=3041785 RepID=UPI0027900F67|nr:hypothetical protein [Microbacterium sp. SORGH_AS_1204]MDQ1138189.1 hypothetical protein [Microbacterium sp. SORGH_AS_1204]
MTATATAPRRSAPIAAHPAAASWPRTAGILILAGGVMLTGATALEVGADVATDPGPATAFWVLFLGSVLAQIAAMFPLALGRGDGHGAVGSSLVGKLALLGFGAFLLANHSLYLVVTYLMPTATPGVGAMAFVLGVSAVQGMLLVFGGVVIARAGVLRGAARWAILVLSLVGFALGAVVSDPSNGVLTDVMYFVSTGAQIVAGILIARATLSAAK